MGMKTEMQKTEFGVAIQSFRFLLLDPTRASNQCILIEQKFQPVVLAIETCKRYEKESLCS